MKRTTLLIFALACVLLMHVPASSQRRAAAGTKQTRVVRGQVLTSTYLPPIRIRFDKGFKYVGSQKFILYERAQAEQHFFVDADARRRIRRMYMLQFESYLPGVDAKYDYAAAETVKLGGEDYIVNAESVPNVAAALAQSPQSDSARAVEFLKGKGYSVGESVRFQRFVRLVDESKRSEFIMLYVEDAGASGADEKAMREFRERASKGFAVLK
ncbi:MAG TPA: hypothetical protein VE642_04555 [Pyrinomonadaceae bacterium]|nr:hypothetical protein [Pyrinomonadaceae bacterium]